MSDSSASSQPSDATSEALRQRVESNPSQASVSMVRQAIRETGFDGLPKLLEALEADSRSGVRSAVRSARGRMEREAAQRRRVTGMYEYARQLGGEGILLGVDEVGRGSVAGPLTVAAVALPDEPVIWGIDDSKRLTPERRELLETQIRQHALAIGIAHVPPADIDACGMAASLRVAMTRAIAEAGIEPDAVLIDGLPMHVHPREIDVVHGDARVACIAAASIVAKVTRDRIMVKADTRYPGYDFAKSKGYASPEHIAAIRRLGLTDYHRATFCHNFLED